MKKILIIGSTVVDIILKIPYIPKSSEDVNVNSMYYRIGGCAYNVYSALKKMDIPATLCSPVGSGIYGTFVKEHFNKTGIEPFIILEEANGCCYCLVEPDGERSFLSYHGAEYLFNKSWMNNIDISLYNDVYISGLEIEEDTGMEIVNFLYENPDLKFFYAPGSRIMHIAKEKMNLLLSRRDSYGMGPLLHLNEKELLSYTGQDDLECAALKIHENTLNYVIVTLGDKGSAYYDYNDKMLKYVPIMPVKATNTVGAGDIHFGVFIACYKNACSIENSCLEANKAAAKMLSLSLLL